MKKLLLLCLLLIPVAGIAQENTAKDTILYVNGRKISIKEGNGKIKVKLYEQSSHGDTIENDQIFEGVYMDGQSRKEDLSWRCLLVNQRNRTAILILITPVYIWVIPI